MSAYRGRTGPNFSQYLNDLNAISPPEYPFASGEENEFSNDLAMYTNTDFTNLDVPGLPEDGAFNFDLSPDTQAQEGLKFEELLTGSGPSSDFHTAGTVADTVAPNRPQSFFSSYNTPIQPAPASSFAAGETLQRGQGDAGHSRVASLAPTENASAEEKSRLAAEEDKRRRNTAASARFRVKKKQREQALEKTLKETQEKNSKLEAKNSQLELENQWLKDLITEKNGLSSREEIAAAFEKHRKESEERDLKTEPAHTTGVGTV